MIVSLFFFNENKKKEKKMKKILVLTASLLIALSTMGFSQDTLDVPAIDQDGQPIINAIIKYVVADTASDGSQLHDVYRLQRGSVYFYNQSPVFNKPITLIADDPGDTFETRPPKLIITTNDEGEYPYEHCLSTFADLTVKNIAFSTTSLDYSAYTWANAIFVGTEGVRVDIIGCHFNLTGWGIIEATQQNCKLFMSQSHIRNCLVKYGEGADAWCPFFFELTGGSVDSLVVTNNTFYNMTGSILNIEQQARVSYFVFDHNTLVNVGRGLTPLKSHVKTIITNNIFYNAPHFNQIEAEIVEDDDSMPMSVINIDTLTSNEPDAPDSIASQSPMPENERYCLVENNVYHWSQGLKDYWQAASDSIVPLYWMNEVTAAMFADDEGYPGFIANNNVETDLTFSNFGGVDAMVEAVKVFDHATAELPFYGWDPDSAIYGEYHWGILGWPLPEDFSYSESVMGNDGKPVGDLRWYPEYLDGYTAPVDVNENTNRRVVKNSISLKQNYPNPFNPSTTIEYQLTRAANVKLTVFNVLGQEIKQLVDENSVAAGSHKVVWNGKDNNGKSVANGVYFYKLSTDDKTEVKKMVFMK